MPTFGPVAGCAVTASDSSSSRMASFPRCPSSSMSSARARTSSRPRPSSPRAVLGAFRSGSSTPDSTTTRCSRTSSSPSSPCPSLTSASGVGLRQPRSPDRGDHGRARGRAHGPAAGPGRRLRRRELDARGRARLREDAHPGRARRGRPALVRRDDARGDQPPRHRRAGGPAVRDRAGGHRATSPPRASPAIASSSSATR